MTEKNRFETLYLRFAFEDDHKAYKELFYEFYPSLCIFAGRYISSSDACEDIVQEVFFSIWKNRKSLNIHSSFRNFLVTSVRNRCLDYLRRESTHNMYVENFNSSVTSLSPGDVYTMKELEEMVKTALQKLPPKIKSAFEMSRTQNMTYNEISIEMDISPKTVESYISQALKKLRIELKDYLPLIFLFTFFE